MFFSWPELYFIMKKKKEKHIFATSGFYDKITAAEKALKKGGKLMKTMKKIFAAGLVVSTLAIGSVEALAASQYETPAEAIAGLTGREVQSVIDERTETGKTYGTIANEAGVLTQLKTEMLEMKKEMIAARVAAGTLTQAQADAILARIESNQAECDGSGTGCGLKGTGRGMGAGFGQGGGQARGQRGQGGGYGLRNGSCMGN